MGHAETDYMDPYVTEGGQEVERPADMIRANSLESVERRHRVLKLRRQGFTSEQIAEILSKGGDDGPPIEISPRGVRHQLRNYMESLRGEDAETVEILRQLDSERLEAMFKRLEIDARDEDPAVRRQAMLAQLRVLERHAKLHGLDAPQKLEVGGAVDHNLIASPEHVRAVDASFAERHGNQVLELPAGDVSEE
jgi:DNA-binding transcriptional MerR regulator